MVVPLSYTLDMLIGFLSCLILVEELDELIICYCCPSLVAIGYLTPIPASLSKGNLTLTTGFLSSSYFL